MSSVGSTQKVEKSSYLTDMSGHEMHVKTDCHKYGDTAFFDGQKKQYHS